MPFYSVTWAQKIPSIPCASVFFWHVFPQLPKSVVGIWVPEDLGGKRSPGKIWSLPLGGYSWVKMTDHSQKTGQDTWHSLSFSADQYPVLWAPVGGEGEPVRWSLGHHLQSHKRFLEASSGELWIPRILQFGLCLRLPFCVGSCCSKMLTCKRAQSARGHSHKVFPGMAPFHSVPLRPWEAVLRNGEEHRKHVFQQTLAFPLTYSYGPWVNE